MNRYFLNNLKNIMWLVIIIVSVMVMGPSLVVKASGGGEQTVATVSYEDTNGNTITTNYTSLVGSTGALQGAMDNAGSTLKLLEDVELEDCSNIDRGDFCIDLNGKTIESGTAGIAILITGGKVTFEDSSSEKTGWVKGSSSALDIRDAEVTIKGGNYKANTWTINTSHNNANLKIEDGYFEGGVTLCLSTGKNVVISGGHFKAEGFSVWNFTPLSITGGVFDGEIYNGGDMELRGGKINYYKGVGTGTYSGIENRNILNIYGGTILNTDDDGSAYGITNCEEGTLNIYKDFECKDFTADIRVENDIDICGDLSKKYSIYRYITSGVDSVSFAKATDDSLLVCDNFTSEVSGYIVKKQTAGTLALYKCTHDSINKQYACNSCGLQMCASIDDEYYLSLNDAFDSLKDATKADNKSVKILCDITEDGETKGGTYTIDLNGKKINGGISVSSNSNITLRADNGEIDADTSIGLSISEEAYVKIEGQVTIKGGVAVGNSGTLDIDGSNVKLIAGDIGIENIGVLNMRGGYIKGGMAGILNAVNTNNVKLLGGTIEGTDIAVLNIGGNMEIGYNDGIGPIIKGYIGVMNTKLNIEDMKMDAKLVILGGTFEATEDIYNKTGKQSIFSSEEIEFIAADVVLRGGTFTDGIKIVVNKESDLLDILAAGYGYYNVANEKIDVADGEMEIKGTTIVRNINNSNMVNDGVSGGASSSVANGKDTNKGTNTEDIENVNGKTYGTNKIDTGDDKNVLLWIGLMTITMMGIIYLYSLRRYRRERATRKG